MFSEQRTKHCWRKDSFSIARTTLCFYFLIYGFCRAGNTALLQANLKTFQVHACDGEELKLECVRHTVISIYWAQYGRYVPSNQLCPHTPHPILSHSSSSMSTSSHHNTSSQLNHNQTTDCSSSDSLRYSLLQTVEAGCREQRICKFMTSPQSFGGIDPCPGVTKYAEVVYKCSPNTFYNKIICAGNKLQLKCHKSLRIAIFKASFGSTLTGVPECSKPHSSQTKFPSANLQFPECQVSFATEIVMSSCFGKKKCTLEVDISTFGDPGCPKNAPLHLKVVYTCVPKEVLLLKENDSDNSDKITSDNSSEENSENDYNGFIDEPRYVPETKESQLKYMNHSFNHIDESNKKVKKGDSNGKTSQKSGEDKNILIKNIDSNVQDNCTDIKVIGFISDWISAVNFIKQNTEKFILYLLVSICGSLVCFLVVLSSRLYLQKRKVVKKARQELPFCTPFGALSDQNADDILDQLDGTILTEPLNQSNGNSHHHHHHTIEISRFGTANHRNSSVRRQGSDTNPRSLTRSLNNYYYS